MQPPFLTYCVEPGNLGTEFWQLGCPNISTLHSSFPDDAMGRQVANAKTCKRNLEVLRYLSWHHTGYKPGQKGKGDTRCTRHLCKGAPWIGAWVPPGYDVDVPALASIAARKSLTIFVRKCYITDQLNTSHLRKRQSEKLRFWTPPTPAGWDILPQVVCVKLLLFPRTVQEPSTESVTNDPLQANRAAGSPLMFPRPGTVRVRWARHPR